MDGSCLRWACTRTPHRLWRGRARRSWRTDQTRRLYLCNPPCSSTCRDLSHFQCFSALSRSFYMELQSIRPLRTACSGVPEGVWQHLFQGVFRCPTRVQEMGSCSRADPWREASNCKVYLLAPTEKKELDQFLKENLETGWICPSKSPMASLVFFIKKKDSTLQLVQDYWALKVMTVKNKYPLPLTSALINKLSPSHTLFLWTVLWTLSYRNNDLLIISIDHILSDRWSYLTDDLMFPYISLTCARRILWILLTCFRHVLHTAYARHSFLMLRISCLQHALLMTYACLPYCLHAYFTI